MSKSLAFCWKLPVRSLPYWNWFILALSLSKRKTSLRRLSVAHTVHMVCSSLGPTAPGCFACWGQAAQAKASFDTSSQTSARPIYAELHVAKPSELRSKMPTELYEGISENIPQCNNTPISAGRYSTLYPVTALFSVRQVHVRQIESMRIKNRWHV